MDKRTFDEIRRLVYQKSGITLGEHKEALVIARVSKRLRALKLETPADYLKFLKADSSGSELVQLLDVISTNVTSFFREPRHFELLTKLMRQWLAQGQRRFRFWSAACSTGAEPYTMAMTILGALERDENPEVKILSTDISTKMLAQCSSGIYETDKLSGVSQTQMERYFNRVVMEDGHPCWQANEKMRRMLLVRRLNLSEPPFPMKGPMDAVFCRNVMIYFDQGVRSRLLSEIFRLLKPGGYLFVGHAESLVGIDTPFKSVQPSVYVKS